MSEADRQRWDARYERPGLLMGPDPKPWVLGLAPVLPRIGRALEIACGEGQLALWLAQRGLHVTAIDISPAALAKLRTQAAADGLSDRVDVIETDLDGGLPPVEPGLALVSCIDFFSPPLMAAARALLAPGGMLMVQVLLQPPGGDSPHKAAPGEALAFAAGLRIHYYREGQMGGRDLAQLLAQRPPAPTLPVRD